MEYSNILAGWNFQLWDSTNNPLYEEMFFDRIISNVSVTKIKEKFLKWHAYIATYLVFGPLHTMLSFRMSESLSTLNFTQAATELT